VAAVTAVGRMEVKERRDYAQGFRGAQVRVTFTRGYREPIVGRVITVAITTDGTSADQLIMDVSGDGYYPVAYSLATIGTIERVAP
jgi:hypothetical protein